MDKNLKQALIVAAGGAALTLGTTALGINPLTSGEVNAPFVAGTAIGSTIVGGAVYGVNKFSDKIKNLNGKKKSDVTKDNENINTF